MLSSPDSGHNPLLPKDMDPVFGKNRKLLCVTGEIKTLVRSWAVRITAIHVPIYGVPVSSLRSQSPWVLF